MESKLYEASLQADVTSLTELLKEDPLILEREITGYGNESPLHISAICGHIEFAAKLLILKPELASEVDSKGFSPLHLASLRKHVEMVRVLLASDPDVCVATDQDGRTPLHLASMKRQLENVKLLIETKPDAIKILLNQEENILHFCVKHNSLEALKLLIELVGSRLDPTNEDQESVTVNSRDYHGNTILHLAVARKQVKMIKYLVNNSLGIEINALNKNGFTAMDILANQTIKELKDIEVEELLRHAGGLSSREQSSTSDHNQTVVISEPSNDGINIVPENDNTKISKDPLKDWITNKQNILMVVAVLMATMAFQAGTSPPGGVWQDDSKLEFDTDPSMFYYYAVSTDKCTSGDSKAIEQLRSYTNSTVFFPQQCVMEDIWTSNISNHTGFSPYLLRYAGTSIMAYRSPTPYWVYIACNTIGFYSSLSIILLLLSGLPCKQKVFV
ncbi:ankyrin repeat-containing protein BDA1-like [Papaver somniferum]|uniref:ankyrin repeat-containing protein BDA1-like n=1 Tax=Papaver somniferum TaxID=3469 RepID=UPI000E6FAA29|nr:ankyrin repeat-containing protein BDA1-like [Papaver somniferum]